MAMLINFSNAYPKKRAFLSDPVGFSFKTSSTVELKAPPVRTINDYRDEIPKIRDQILSSNQAHSSLYLRNLRGYQIKTGRTIQEYPFKFVPNLLGINSIAEPFLQTKIKYQPEFEPLIIETGNLIYATMKEEHLEAFYLENLGKIIVLSSSEISIHALQLAFEKYAFQTGLYPIVASDRTEFGDLRIYLSDEPAPRVMPFTLPSKEEIYTYLHNNKSVIWEIAPHIIALISEKLEKKPYNPQSTIDNLLKVLSYDNVKLNHEQIRVLETALPRYSTGFPSRK